MVRDQAIKNQLFQQHIFVNLLVVPSMNKEFLQSFTW